MADLPMLERNQVLDTRPIMQMPSTGTAAVWENVARVTAGLSDQFQKEAAAADAKYLAGLENDVKKNAVELRHQYNHDPEGFKTAWEGFKAGKLANVPGRIQEAARIAIDERGVGVHDTLLGERRSRDRGLAAESINQQYQNIQNEILAEARNGTFGPKIDQLSAKASAIMQSAVNLELKSAQAAQIEMDDLFDLAKAEGVLGGAERTYETKGYETAIASLEALRDPALNLTPAQRDSLIGRGESLITAQYSRDQKVIAEQRAAQVADLDFKIGSAALEEDVISLDKIYAETEKSTFLKPDQKVDRLLKIKKAQADISGSNANASLVYANLGGASVLDPTDPDHKKAANKVFEKQIVPSLVDKTPAEAEQTMLDFIGKTNIVPDAVKNQLVGGIAAGSPETQVRMAGQLTQLLDNAPFSASSFNEQTIARARHITALTQGGMSDPEEVVRMVQEAEKATPEVKKIRAQESKDGKHPEKNASFLRAQSDVWGPVNVNIPIELKAEFDSMQQEYYSKNGNLEASQKAAWDTVSNVWGVSEVGMGGKRWTKYAPEKLVPNGDSEWIEKQLIQDVKTIRPDKEYSKKDISLQYDDRTRNEVGAGQVPSYQIWVQEDGLMKPLMTPDGRMQRYVPDYKSSEKHLKNLADHQEMIVRDTEALRRNREEMDRFIKMKTEEQNAD
jgi:tRNA splicing endonuclease